MKIISETRISTTKYMTKSVCLGGHLLSFEGRQLDHMIDRSIHGLRMNMSNP